MRTISTVAAIALAVSVSPSIAADIQQPSTRVKGICIIFGTHITAPYEGKLEMVVGRTGKARRTGVLSMTGQASKASIEKRLLELSEDHERFGVSQMQAPTIIFLAKVEERDGMPGLSVGYGHGDVGDGVSKTEWNVPMACDLTVLPK